jgi:hypothetical protein
VVIPGGTLSRPQNECYLYHVHLFVPDLNASIRFYTEMFGAGVAFDNVLAGVRNAKRPVKGPLEGMSDV